MTTMTTTTNDTMTDFAREFCRAIILSNAEDWFRKRYPRTFARSADTDKHMRAKMKRENDELFAAQNEEFDNALMAWYEQTYTIYGGDVNDLPWVLTLGTHEVDVS